MDFPSNRWNSRGQSLCEFLLWHVTHLSYLHAKSTRTHRFLTHRRRSHACARVNQPNPTQPPTKPRTNKPTARQFAIVLSCVYSIARRIDASRRRQRQLRRQFWYPRRTRKTPCTALKRQIPRHANCRCVCSLRGGYDTMLRGDDDDDEVYTNTGTLQHKQNIKTKLNSRDFSR